MKITVLVIAFDEYPETIKQIQTSVATWFQSVGADITCHIVSSTKSLSGKYVVLMDSKQNSREHYILDCVEKFSKGCGDFMIILNSHNYFNSSVVKDIEKGSGEPCAWVGADENGTLSSQGGITINEKCVKLLSDMYGAIYSSTDNILKTVGQLDKTFLWLRWLCEHLCINLRVSTHLSGRDIFSVSGLGLTVSGCDSVMMSWIHKNKELDKLIKLPIREKKELSSMIKNIRTLNLSPISFKLIQYYILMTEKKSVEREREQQRSVDILEEFLS